MLAGGAVLVGAALLILMWLAISLKALHGLAPVLAVLGVGAWLVMAVLVGGLLWVASGREWGQPRFWLRVLHGGFPLVETLARCAGRGAGEEGGSLKERVRHAFIQINNELVLRQSPRCTAEQLLILLPHCLQASHCPLRLTHHLDNCKRCGKCTLRDFLNLRDALGVKLAVAPGGTIARRIVRRDRPQIIVAVACERDLAAGIQDCAPLPVFGVLNERPFGPCVDTWVPMTGVESAVRQFITS